MFLKILILESKQLFFGNSVRVFVRLVRGKDCSGSKLRCLHLCSCIVMLERRKLCSCAYVLLKYEQGSAASWSPLIGTGCECNESRGAVWIISVRVIGSVNVYSHLGKAYIDLGREQLASLMHCDVHWLLVQKLIWRWNPISLYMVRQVNLMFFSWRSFRNNQVFLPPLYTSQYSLQDRNNVYAFR
jgi:hypothetical protein